MLTCPVISKKREYKNNIPYAVALLVHDGAHCGFVWQVVATFQRMRQEQRSMASKAAELEMDINEHRSVQTF